MQNYKKCMNTQKLMVNFTLCMSAFSLMQTQTEIYEHYQQHYFPPSPYLGQMPIITQNSSILCVISHFSELFCAKRV